MPTLLTKLTRMKRKRFFDTPAAREFHPRPRLGGCYHMPESAKSLAHARRLRAGLPEPLTFGGLCQTVLEGLALLSALVLAASLGFWVVVAGEAPVAASWASSVASWALGVMIGIVSVLLTVNLCRKS
jgi:hypothetical protein